jgi:hypothetical protein
MTDETKASTAELLRFIADNLDWLAHREDAETAFDELGTVHLLLEVTIGARVLGPYAGPCDVCGRDMYARTGATIVECRHCALEWDLEPRRAWLLGQVGDQLATAADLSRALGGLGVDVRPETIRKWRERKLLHPAGTDRSGRPLYRVRDVQQLVARPTRHGRSGTHTGH